MKYYLLALKKYGVFNGRASRAEYWYFVLFNFIISFAIGFIEGFLEINDIFSTLYSLLIIVPSVAVGVRRMHDVNKSGWFLLVPIYSLILLIRKGDDNTNKYGDKPQNIDIPATEEIPEKSVVSFCSGCGSQMEVNSKFCTKCGKKSVT